MSVTTIDSYVMSTIVPSESSALMIENTAFLLAHCEGVQFKKLNLPQVYQNDGWIFHGYSGWA